MDNESGKCECKVDIEGYQQCESCANGITNPADFFSYYDTIMNDEFCDHVPEY